MWDRILIGRITNFVPEFIEVVCNELTGAFRLLVQRLLNHLRALDAQINELESQIVQWHRQSNASSNLEQIPGIGHMP